ncbi:hypothetical protein T484DRAFT_1784389, partial [Baffinella frigidus]
MASTATDVYVGGRIRAAGGQEVQNVAQWDGNQWVVQNVAQWDGNQWVALLDIACLRSQSAVCGVDGE